MIASSNSGCDIYYGPVNTLTPPQRNQPKLYLLIIHSHSLIMFFLHNAALSHWRRGMLTLPNDLEWSFSESRLLINNKHNFLRRVYVSLRWNNYSSSSSRPPHSSYAERLWSLTSDGWELSNMDGCAALHYALAATEKSSAHHLTLTGGNARWLKCCLPYNCMQCEHMNSKCM